MIFKEKIISSQENSNGTKSAVATSRNINFVYGLFVVVGAIVGFTLVYGEQSSLQICQQNYMKATNEISMYNEENPEYAVSLPEYNCNTITSTGTHSTGITVPPPTIEQIDDAYILTPLWLKICKKNVNSPLCKDRALFDRLYQITEERLPNKQFFPILIGITNAESSLGLDFARDKVGGFCNGRNNWGGTKYQIHDDNTRTYKRLLNGFDYEYNRAKKLHNDQFGCNLYPFESIEEFWITKVNGMRYGYKGCIDSKTPIKCLSYQYVGAPEVSEQSWINNVSEFLLN